MEPRSKTMAKGPDAPWSHRMDNEDLLNMQLASSMPWAVDPDSLQSPHVKADLLLQARHPLVIARRTGWQRRQDGHQSD